MAGYLLKRIFSTIIVLWVIATITFFLMHAVPGGPFTGDKNLPEAIQKNIAEKYKLNDPLFKQYGNYMKGILQGDFGPSFRYEGRDVLKDIILPSFPVSATLGFVAIVLSLGIGISAGTIAALNQNKWQDYTAMVLSTIGVSVPGFILATLLIYVFALKFGILPASMWGTPQQVILPAIALSGLPTAFIARLTRSSMLEVMQQDYIKTARAKGLNAKEVIFKHALRNAITPVISYLGPLIAGILTGSFVIEQIFAIPGLGQFFVTSVANRDYTVIMGVTIFYSFLLVMMNLIVDLAYVWIDPRVKLQQ